MLHGDNDKFNEDMVILAYYTPGFGQLRTGHKQQLISGFRALDVEHGHILVGPTFQIKVCVRCLALY